MIPPGTAGAIANRAKNTVGSQQEKMAFKALIRELVIRTYRNISWLALKSGMATLALCLLAFVEQGLSGFLLPLVVSGACGLIGGTLAYVLLLVFRTQFAARGTAPAARKISEIGILIMIIIGTAFSLQRILVSPENWLPTLIIFLISIILGVCFGMALMRLTAGHSS